MEFIIRDHIMNFLFVNFHFTLCLKNDNKVAHYKFSAHEPILLIVDRGVAKRISYYMVICYPTCPS